MSLFNAATGPSVPLTREKWEIGIPLCSYICLFLGICTKKRTNKTFLPKVIFDPVHSLRCVQFGVTA